MIGSVSFIAYLRGIVSEIIVRVRGYELVADGRSSCNNVLVLGLERFKLCIYW